MALAHGKKESNKSKRRGREEGRKWGLGELEYNTSDQQYGVLTTSTCIYVCQPDSNINGTK